MASDQNEIPGGEAELQLLISRYGAKRIRTDRLTEEGKRLAILDPDYYDEYSDESLEGRDEKQKRKLSEAQWKDTIVRHAAMSCRAKKTLDVNVNLKYLQAGTILTVQRRSKIDHLRQELIKPKRHVPPTHLPDWYTKSLDSKIPLLKAGDAMKYSRGNLGQPLQQRFGKPTFTLYDPLNQRSVPEYCGLHDPAMKPYLHQTHVRKLLKKQGLLNDDDEVLCSIAEFNKYRVYLRNNHYNELHNHLAHMDNRELHLRQEVYALASYKARLSKATKPKPSKRAQEDEDTFVTHIKHRVVHGYERELEKAEKKSVKMQTPTLAKQLLTENKNKYMKKVHEVNMARVIRLEEDFRARTKAKYEAREKHAQERVEARQKKVVHANREYQLDWLDAKYEHQVEDLKEYYGIENAIVDELKEKAKVYLARVEAKRKSMPEILDKIRANKKRVYELKKKYFYIWLNKFRASRAGLSDVEHNSTWSIPAVTHEFVDYLHEKSGFRFKLDDVTLDMLNRNARQLKKLRHEKKRQQKKRSK